VLVLAASTASAESFRTTRSANGLKITRKETISSRIHTGATRLRERLTNLRSRLFKEARPGEAPAEASAGERTGHRIRILSRSEPAKIALPAGARWTKQTNMYDCGPAMLLNSAAMLEIKAPDRTIAAVRAKMSELRAVDHEPALKADEWVSVHDVSRYAVAALGLRPEGSLAVQPHGSIDHIVKEIDTTTFRVMVATRGNHFRAFLPDRAANTFIVLDSFENGPARIGRQELLQFIEESRRDTDVFEFYR
jgi:hypothetical protein